jgi:hypothetical protein
MSFIHEDGSETSWTDHMVPEPDEFGWVIEENLNVEFDDDFIRHLDPEDQYRVRCIQVAKENEAAMEPNYGALDSFMAIFGFHRVSQKDITSEPNKEGSMDPMNANMLPEAQAVDIELEFAALAEEGDVTTLDVKNSLRKKFWVNQNEVSRAVWDFVQAQSPKFSFRYENGHRVYFLAQNATAGTVGSGYNSPLYDPKSVAFNRPKAKRAPAIGDWSIDARGFSSAPVQYKGMTRNQARYDFAKTYGVKYIYTFARKIN